MGAQATVVWAAESRSGAWVAHADATMRAGARRAVRAGERTAIDRAGHRTRAFDSVLPWGRRALRLCLSVGCVGLGACRAVWQPAGLRSPQRYARGASVHGSKVRCAGHHRGRAGQSGSAGRVGRRSAADRRDRGPLRGRGRARSSSSWRPRRPARDVDRGRSRAAASTTVGSGRRMARAMMPPTTEPAARSAAAGFGEVACRPPTARGERLEVQLAVDRDDRDAGRPSTTRRASCRPRRVARRGLRRPPGRSPGARRERGRAPRAARTGAPTWATPWRWTSAMAGVAVAAMGRS
jgi:hypothetical protein